MEYSELIATRYSVRAYRPDPVEDEKLQAVLEAARLAPTAANRQPIQLIVMHTAGREEEIGKIYRRPWFVQAPLVIAVCAISSQAWVRESDRFNARLIDAAIVADHLILAAANLGLAGSTHTTNHIHIEKLLESSIPVRSTALDRLYKGRILVDYLCDCIQPFFK